MSVAAPGPGKWGPFITTTEEDRDFGVIISRNMTPSWQQMEAAKGQQDAGNDKKNIRKERGFNRNIRNNEWGSRCAT